MTNLNTIYLGRPEYCQAHLAPQGTLCFAGLSGVFNLEATMTDKQKAADKTLTELEETAERYKGQPAEALLRGYIRRLEREAGLNGEDSAV